MYFSAFIEGHISCFHFFFSKLSIFSALPDWVQNPSKLEAKLAKLSAGAPVVMSVPAGPALVYNQDYASLASNLRTLHQGLGAPGNRYVLWCGLLFLNNIFSFGLQYFYYWSRIIVLVLVLETRFRLLQSYN